MTILWVYFFLIFPRVAHNIYLLVWWWLTPRSIILPLMLLVRISIRARCTTLCDKVCLWLATGRWFSLCPIMITEEFEDTKGVIIIRKSKDRQHNGQKRKNKSTNNDLQNITHKNKRSNDFIIKHQDYVEFVCCVGAVVVVIVW
jgi:hypothetical protein